MHDLAFTSLSRRPCRGLLAAVLAAALAVPAAGQQDSRERPPPGPPAGGPGILATALYYPTRGERQRSVEFLERWARVAPDKITAAEVIDLYKNVDFHLVREACKEGIQFEGKTVKLGPETSMAIANVRDQMIEAAYSDAARDFKIEFQKLDFGNKKSGAKSDVDHTAFTDFDHPALQGKDLRAEIEDRFRKRWGLTQEACDVCVHSGLNRVPDWRGSEDVATFRAKMVEVLRGLESTPEAYAYEGAWRMQVEWRSLHAVEDIRKRLEVFRKEIGEAGVTPERRARIDQEIRDALASSPLTRFRLKEGGGISVEKELEMLGKLFEGIRPDVLKAYAFDAAVGNYFFHLTHADKTEEPKYLLRSFNEGLALMRPLAPGERVGPVEYEALDHERRAELIRKLYPDFDEAKRREAKLVYDIAADLRNNHKNPKTKKPEGEVWGLLVEHLKTGRIARSKLLHGRAPADEAQLLAWARHTYDHLSTELMAWNNLYTSRARTEAWRNPGDEPLWKLYQGSHPEAALEKLQLASFYALKKAFGVLPDGQVERIIQSADPRDRMALDVLRQAIGAERAVYGRIDLDPVQRDLTIRQRLDAAVEGIEKHFRGRYEDFRAGLEAGSFSDEAISQGFWEKAAELVGYEYKLGRAQFEGQSPGWVREWNPSKFLGNLVSAGNVASALHVLQVYLETDDRDQVIATLLNEALYRLPLFAHALAGRDALIDGRWDGAKLLVGARLFDLARSRALDNKVGWLVPFGGEVILFVDVARTSLEIVGHEVFTPLRGDDADLLYSGFAGPTRFGFESPPPEFTAEDGRALDGARERLAADLRKIADPGIPLASQKDLIEDARALRRTVPALERKKKSWEAYDARRRQASAWEAGLISPGLRARREAGSFRAVIEMVTLDDGFFCGPQGMVRLGARPLGDAERSRLDDLRRLRDALGEGGAKGDPIDQAAKLADVLDEMDVLEEREAEAVRADAYRRKIASDPEWSFEARRQNVFRFVDREVCRRLQETGGYPSEDRLDTEDQSLAYFTAKQKAVPETIREMVRRWVDEHFPAGMNEPRLQAAIDRCAERMIADYASSEKLTAVFDEWKAARERPDARREREQRRRQYLRTRAVDLALESGLSAGRDACEAYGTLVLAGTPPADPIVRVDGEIVESGGEELAEVRVKVIASPVDFPPPYQVRFSVREGRAEGSARSRILVASVLDARGKELGKGELPFRLAGAGSGRDVSTTAGFLPPKLVLLSPTPGDLANAWSPGVMGIRAALTGVAQGVHRMTVKLGSRSVTVWGRVVRLGDAAIFHGEIYVPPGTHAVTLEVAGVPPLTFEISGKPAPDRTAEIAKDEAQVASSAQSVRRQQTEARRLQALARHCFARSELAWELRYVHRIDEAKRLLLDTLALMPAVPPPATGSDDPPWPFGSVLDRLIEAAYLGGDLRTMALAYDRYFQVYEVWNAALRRKQTASAARDLQDAIRQMARLYEKYAKHWALLGGDAPTARRLWEQGLRCLDQVGEPHAGPEFHPEWGGEP
jgi:hypothetical protein